MLQDCLGNPINCDSDRPLFQCVCMSRKKIKEKGVWAATSKAWGLSRVFVEKESRQNWMQFVFHITANNSKSGIVPWGSRELNLKKLVEVTGWTKLKDTSIIHQTCLKNSSCARNLWSIKVKSFSVHALSHLHHYLTFNHLIFFSSNWSSYTIVNKYLIVCSSNAVYKFDIFG